ncbi:nucleolar protein (nucleomorph) [Cryptomonas paramecium]|uniref:Nucleolar protein 56 n=1 Tax=Cryptomonas paramaecium TaxID=2898 RepID=F2HHS6_9CRYP|nr:nucleolar protein [Cryptomonas paramecium]AEA38872.1 nucleolar protein [Cryptomonas paramecium]|mmetsp:Transcript_36629/g.96486  ORF Transcript_36629/g.96486 Transcript_36629/m.96486 type:complete len:413 (-) Transcript_36629:1975-3213(-)
MLLLYENVMGYFLFVYKKSFVNKLNPINFKKSIFNDNFFFKNITLLGFSPFISTNHAFQNIVCINESICNSYLLKFVIRTLKKLSYKTKLGVLDFKLAASIYKFVNIKITSNENMIKVTKIIKTYFERFKNKWINESITKSQRVMAYFFSQSKVKISQIKNENIVFHIISLIEQIDIDINMLTMICREWYSWYFPELSEIIKENFLYSLIIKFVGNKAKLDVKKLPELEIITNCKNIAKKIFQKARFSIGSNISKIDLLIVRFICLQIFLINKFRNKLLKYLKKKTNLVFPNLTELLGEVGSAKLVSSFGCLKNLVKLSSSTVQMLSTEKKSLSISNRQKNVSTNFLFNNHFASKIKNCHKKQFTRHLTDKLVMAARVDYFSTVRNKLYGKIYKYQIAHKMKKKIFAEDGTV